MQWKKARGCEAGHCPEVAVYGNGMIGIRSSAEPDKVTWFNETEWRDLVAEMRNEHPFGVDANGYFMQ